MILVTTSRRPSPKSRSFIKDLVSIIPYAQKINRGHKSLVELAFEARKLGYRYILIVSDRRGNPSKISIYEVREEYQAHPKLEKLVTLELKGVKLSRENPEASRTYGVRGLSVDASNCISNECFYIADLMSKIFQRILNSRPEITLVLSEGRFLELKFINIHGKPVGPVLRIIRVIEGDRDEY
ncbi:MAG: ribosomal biogenesis protein [Desulfurococcaceae archaeon]